MGIALSLLTIIWIGVLLVKKYKPQTILFVAGLFLMFSAIVISGGNVNLVPPAQHTGSVFLDAFEFIKSTLSSRAAGLGLNIMAVGGFARYMDSIGASHSLVKITSKPLLALRAPYLVMSAIWVLGMFLGLAINSASGLAMLLMVTVFPVLVSLGVSRLSAVAAIATTLCLDWSPSDTGTILAAETANMHFFDYWRHYQLPVAAAVIPIVAVLHYFTQKWMDKRDGHEVKGEDVSVMGAAPAAEKNAPAFYAILPTVPLALILICNTPMLSFIKMDVIKSMILGLAIAMTVDYLFCWNGKKVFADIQSFFDGMGAQMANVVTLIVAGETFAQGLISVGSINAVIEFAKTSHMGGAGMIVLMVAIIIICSILMGSGNAPFFAFAKLVPEVAQHVNVPVAAFMLPMHFAASSARTMSPITAVVVVASGMGGVSPFDVVKRTAIPMIGSLITILVMNFVLFY